MEKTVITCIGKYLEGSGIDSIFTNNNVFGSGVVTSVLEGGHYSGALRGLSLFS